MKTPKKSANQLKLFADVAPKRRARKIVADTEWSARALKAQGDIVLGAMVNSGLKHHTVESILRSLDKLGHGFDLCHVKAGLADLGPKHRGLIVKHPGGVYTVKGQRS